MAKVFLSYFLKHDDFRLGIGISTHWNMKLKVDGFAPDIDFTSDMGVRVELGYKWVALTYTFINYKDEVNTVLAASSSGMSLSFDFPNKKYLKQRYHLEFV